jgi:hypothetical protein
MESFLLLYGSENQDDCIGIQRIGIEVCGCPNLLEWNCSLCENGSPLPDRDFPITVEETCLQISLYFANVDANSCRAGQVTAGVYCGCDNTLSFSSGVCRICGDGLLLPDTQTVVEVDPILFDGSEKVSCAQIEYEANVAEENCEAFRAQFGSLCCNTDDQPIENQTNSIGGSSSGSGIIFLSLAKSITLTAFLAMTMM